MNASTPSAIRRIALSLHRWLTQSRAVTGSHSAADVNQPPSTTHAELAPSPAPVRPEPLSEKVRQALSHVEW